MIPSKDSRLPESTSASRLASLGLTGVWCTAMLTTSILHLQAAAFFGGRGETAEIGHQVTPLPRVGDTGEALSRARNDGHRRCQEAVERLAIPKDRSVSHGFAVIIAGKGAGGAPEQSAMPRPGAVPVRGMTADTFRVFELARRRVAGRRRRRDEQGEKPEACRDGDSNAGRGLHR